MISFTFALVYFMLTLQLRNWTNFADNIIRLMSNLAELEKTGIRFKTIIIIKIWTHAIGFLIH